MAIPSAAIVEMHPAATQALMRRLVYASATAGTAECRLGTSW